MANNALGKNGLTDVNHQRIIAADYTNFSASPVKAGGLVTGTSGLTYQVAAGVAVVKTDADKAVEVAFNATPTAATVPPTSGSAIDTIFVDSEGVVRLTRGEAPAGTCVLSRRNVPANITATTATTETFDRFFALPYGATLPVLAQWWDPGTSGSQARKDKHTMCSISVAVPTDRYVCVQLVQAIASESDWKDLQKLNPGGFKYTISTGANTWRFELGYTRSWEAKERNIQLVPLRQGRNTITVEREHSWGAEPTYFGGGSSGFDKGGVFIIDQGIRQ